jgi:hypothetical protein
MFANSGFDRARNSANGPSRIRQASAIWYAVAAVAIVVLAIVFGWLGYRMFMRDGDRDFADKNNLAKPSQQESEQDERVKKEVRAAKPTSVTIDEVGKDYDESPRQADERYKDKILEVSGIVKTVERFGLGRGRIVFKAGGSLVVCEFSGKELAELSKAREGQAVVIRGRCGGRTGLGVPNARTPEIVLLGCFLVGES